MSDTNDQLAIPTNTIPPVARVRPDAPSLSVIIPTYNRQSTILEAVHSVLNQTLTALEVVVVDDGSTDETLRVLASLRDPRLVVVESGHLGANGARNLGVEESRGRLLTFLDSDDHALPQWAERMAWLLAHADVASCGNLTELSGGRSTATEYPSPFMPFFPEIVSSFRHGGTYGLTRDVFESIGGFAVGLRSSQHTEIGIRIAKFARQHSLNFVSTSEPLIVYRAGTPGSIRKQWDALADGSKFLLETHSDLYKDAPRERADATYRLGVRQERSGNHAESRQAFAESLRARPSARALGRYLQSTLIRAVRL